MLSPAMYRAIAKNTAIIWPHFAHKAPVDLFSQFNPEGLYCEHNHIRCLAEVDRKSNYSPQELAMLRSSDKPEIRYYCELNPHFDRGTALFVIIPVHFYQLIRTFLKKMR